MGPSTTTLPVRAWLFKYRIVIVVVLICLAQLLFLLAIDPVAHLKSDSADYWQRAMGRFMGFDTAPTQYEHHPPAYHILLSWLIHLSKLFGLYENRLSFVLTMQIMLNAAALYCLFKIIEGFTKTIWAVSLVLIYGLFFPGLYLQSFILSENMATPLFILAMYGIVFKAYDWRHLGAAALSFGLAITIRPQYVLYSLPMLYWLWRGQNQKLRAALVLAGGISIVLILGAFEVNRISGGKVNGLANSGGTTFFMAHCPQKVLLYTSEENRGYYVYKNSHPSRGLGSEPYVLPRPPYEQGYYYGEGLKCLFSSFSQPFVNLGYLWFNFSSAPGIVMLWLLLVSLAALASRFLRKRAFVNALWWQVVLTFITTYFFVEHFRYLHAMMVPAYLLVAMLFSSSERPASTVC